MSKESVQFVEMARHAQAQQRIIADALKRGVPCELRCATCGTRTLHRDVRVENVCYSVCTACKRLSTTEAR